ncbi:cell division protein FtsA [Meiothermus granaticius]|uniref:Cell division protein FtsA n=1 Tax=Meiothermus granaticius NBRC 107808 TaxID=1227551 RepID=A0A399FEJ1_9DEIN|nr:cell division protein FtsA [Meiothermus granaticius]RIH93939.1 Cell division protein FtsA [Meiothermus granaticius NBRC 107808]GEM87815.1 cell division protein FtsA [Meiothermus granaticius NBRC 107808]
MILVGLDVGTTKVTAVIGELSSDGILDIIGEGTVPSQGMRRGVVTNLERTSDAIRQAIFQAERVAGVKVERVWVGVAGSHVKSVTSHGLAAIRRGQQITAADVERSIEQAKAYPFDGDYELIHALPLEYRVDGQEGIRDPIGMAGVRLEVDVHLVAGAKGPLTNLRKAVEDAGLEVEGLVLQAYASGLAVLSPEEATMTVMLVDIGGGTTDVAVFRQGRLAHSAVLPLGGDHVAQDIAKLLQIPVEEAERVAKKYGAALPELADPELVLEVSQEGNAQVSYQAPELARIIRPRLREILHLARQSVDEALGPLEITVGKVILTGGTAMVRGLEELARKQFNLPVRLGKPLGVQGLTDVVASPTHATAVGLVRHAATFAAHQPQTRPARGPRAKAPSKSAPIHTEEAVSAANGLWERIKGMFKNFF